MARRVVVVCAERKLGVAGRFGGEIGGVVKAQAAAEAVFFSARCIGLGAMIVVLVDTGGFVVCTEVVAVIMTSFGRSKNLLYEGVQSKLFYA